MVGSNGFKEKSAEIRFTLDAYSAGNPAIIGLIP